MLTVELVNFLMNPVVQSMMCDIVKSVLKSMGDVDSDGTCLWQLRTILSLKCTKTFYYKMDWHLLLIKENTSEILGNLYNIG